VHVFRDGDAMHLGIPAELHDVSEAGVGLIVSRRLEAEAKIHIRLENRARGFTKVVHAIVRWVQPAEGDRCRVGAELFSHLSAGELAALSQAGFPGPATQS
jgi:hypothetical protein